MTIRAGDIVLYRSSSMLGSLIRLASRQTKREAPTRWNHVAVAVSSVDVVEALSTVVQRDLFTSVCGNDYAVYRVNGMSEESGLAVATAARAMVGRKYGYVKMVAHFADYALSRLSGKDVHAFRKLCKIGKYPICSWVVAHSFDCAAKLLFGVPPDEAQPDDIGDWCERSCETSLILTGRG